MSPWTLMITLLILNLLWLGLRGRFVSVTLADAAVMIAMLRWITGPLAALLLFTRGRWTLALLALFWPFIVPVLSIIARPRVGPIQAEFMRRLGYEPTPINPLHDSER